MTDVIRTAQLTKYYGRRRGLDGLDLEVRSGEVYGFRRIGYLSGDFTVDGGQTGRVLLTYLGHLRGGVPKASITVLADRFDLDLQARIGSLSMVVEEPDLEELFVTYYGGEEATDAA